MNSIFSRGVLHITLVHNQLIHKGSQWAVLNASVVYDPLLTHEYRIVIYKGVFRIATQVQVNHLFVTACREWI